MSFCINWGLLFWNWLQAIIINLNLIFIYYQFKVKPPSSSSNITQKPLYVAQSSYTRACPSFSHTGWISMVLWDAWYWRKAPSVKFKKSNRLISYRRWMKWLGTWGQMSNHLFWCRFCLNWSLGRWFSNNLTI